MQESSAAALANLVHENPTYRLKLLLMYGAHELVKHLHSACPNVVREFIRALVNLWAELLVPQVNVIGEVRSVCNVENLNEAKVGIGAQSTSMVEWQMTEYWFSGERNQDTRLVQQVTCPVYAQNNAGGSFTNQLGSIQAH